MFECSTTPKSFNQVEAYAQPGNPRSTHTPYRIFSQAEIFSSEFVLTTSLPGIPLVRYVRQVRLVYWLRPEQLAAGHICRPGANERATLWKEHWKFSRAQRRVGPGIVKILWWQVVGGQKNFSPLQNEARICWCLYEPQTVPDRRIGRCRSLGHSAEARYG